MIMANRLSLFLSATTTDKIKINPFNPRSDQLQFSLSVSHQRYIIQYGELSNSLLK